MKETRKEKKRKSERWEKGFGELMKRRYGLVMKIAAAAGFAPSGNRNGLSGRSVTAARYGIHSRLQNSKTGQTLGSMARWLLDGDTDKVRLDS